MTTQADAETETAETVETQNTAPVVPGRTEVLKHYAREAMGELETAAPATEPDQPAETNKVLSQPESETETVEAPPEETADTPTADDPEETSEDHGGLPPEIQEKIDRRIDKEVARRKAAVEAKEAAEAELAELRAKMAETPEPAAAVKPTALSDIHDPGKLSAEKQRAKEALTQAKDLLFTLEDDPESVEAALRAAKIELRDERGTEDFSRARMKKFLRGVEKKAEWTLTEAIPERADFLEKAERAAQQAQEWMPELKERNSARTKLAMQLLRNRPDIRNNPQWPMELMVGVLGLERFEEMKTNKAKGTTTAQPKPKRELPVNIPQPKAAAPQTAKTKPQPPDANAVADKILNGERKARLDYINQFLPKQS